MFVFCVSVNRNCNFHLKKTQNPNFFTIFFIFIIVIMIIDWHRKPKNRIEYEIVIMYRERGGVGSKAEVASVDRKRINDVLDKQLERSSPSTSRTINGKDRSSSSSLLTAKDHRDPRSGSATIPKNPNASDGEFSIWSRFFNANYFHSIIIMLKRFILFIYWLLIIRTWMIIIILLCFSFFFNWIYSC